MDYQTIILKKQGNIATLTLNRPEKLNAISSQMTREIIQALNEVDDDDEVRVLVITGAGRAFCAGAGVSAAGGTPRGAEEIRRGLTQSSGVRLPKLQKMRKPTIAMVNGLAVGAGCDFAFGCDLRIGSENARFMNAFDMALSKAIDLPFKVPDNQLGLSYGANRIEESASTPEARLLIEEEYRRFIRSLSQTSTMKRLANSWLETGELEVQMSTIADKMLKSGDIFYVCRFCRHLWT